MDGGELIGRGWTGPELDDLPCAACVYDVYGNVRHTNPAFDRFGSAAHDMPPPENGFVVELGGEYYTALVRRSRNMYDTMVLFVPRAIQEREPLASVARRLWSRRLSPRQLGVTIEVLRGRSLRQVAELTGGSVHTVRNHLKAVYARLSVRSRHELVILAASDGRTRTELPV